MTVKVIEFIGNIGDGGAETLVKDYALMLDPKVFSTSIYTIYKASSGANYNRLKNSNVSIYSIYNSHNILTNILKVIFGRWYIPYKIKKFIEIEKPNIIHVHLKFLRYFASISKTLSANNVKLFYTCHCPPSMMLEGKYKCETDAARILIKNNNLQFIALHEEMKKELDQKFNKNNTVVIHNGVDFSKFQIEYPAGYRELFNIPADAFVIGHIGRFSYQKNQMYLLDIFNDLHKRIDNSYLLMIGHGELEHEIKNRIAELNLTDNVIILSHRTDVAELLKIMDVFVFPSRFEGLPVTLVEAQVSGLKCVISDKINPESILSDTTIVVPLDDPVEVWVEKILDNSCLNHNHDNIDQFDLRKEIKRLEELYLG